MIYVFPIDTGTLMTFDMNLALESVEVVKGTTDNAVKVPPDKQTPQTDWETHNISATAKGVKPKRRKRSIQETSASQQSIQFVALICKCQEDYGKGKPQTFRWTWSGEQQQKYWRRLILCTKIQCAC
ncbi:hypothetical protein O3P69_015711 [Scylla paramamosain]|uniref:Uncharacterized protein n=1 Tax=Scylla paramamosain TaxID=85552 RepID=A0AAW0S980_SCYPA